MWRWKPKNWFGFFVAGPEIPCTSEVTRDRGILIQDKFILNEDGSILVQDNPTYIRRHIPLNEPSVSVGMKFCFTWLAGSSGH
jgi:hypothetical protein